MHFFNTAGPVNTLDHYCIDPLQRINLDEMLQLIEQKKYLVLHAPRQTGKSSSLIALSKYINRQGKYQCLYVNLETVFTAQDNLQEGIRNILFDIAARARDYLNNEFPESIVAKILQDKGPNLALNELLTLWSKNSTKSIVLLLDEIDILDGQILISVLSQLRAGYDKRPQFFPRSIILCGVEDIRYKKIVISPDKTITGSSVFNIDAKSIKLLNFTKPEIALLLTKYATEANKTVAPEAIDKIWELTKGQPWIVNALAYEICSEMIPRKQNIENIEEKEVNEAAENLIQRRENHLRNLSDKLNEPHIKRIIVAMLAGTEFPKKLSEEDIRHIYELGLVNFNDGQITIANEIYKEVIPRSLIYSTQMLIRYNLSSFLREDGTLNFKKMLKAFQSVYNHHYTQWHTHFSYNEAGQFLFLQAFLQRIIDGGGSIIRKYGLGRGHFTLIIHWPHAGLIQKHIMDLWLLTKPYDEIVKEGKIQLIREMKACGLTSGELIFFNKELPATEPHTATTSVEQSMVSTKIHKEYLMNIWRI